MTTIVKVQLNELEKDMPHPERAVLIYNESKKIFVKRPLTEELSTRLAGKTFVYVKAAFKKGNLTIFSAVKPPQPMW